MRVLQTNLRNSHEERGEDSIIPRRNANLLHLGDAARTRPRPKHLSVTLRNLPSVSLLLETDTARGKHDAKHVLMSRPSQTERARRPSAALERRNLQSINSSCLRVSFTRLVFTCQTVPSCFFANFRKDKPQTTQK